MKIHLTLNSYEITEHSVPKSFILGPLLWVNIILSSLNTCRFSFFCNDIGNRSDNSAIKQGGESINETLQYIEKN